MITMRSRSKRAMALLADAALSAMAPMLVGRGGAERKRIPPSPRVLLVRCDHIGDAVMATSVLRPLRESLRPATLDVLAGPWAASVFEAHPSVDNVLTVAAPWWTAARSEEGTRASERQGLRPWMDLLGVVHRIRKERYDVGIDLRGDLRHIVFFLVLGGIGARISSDRTGGRRLLTRVWPHDASLHEVEKDFAIASLLGATGDPRLDVAAPGRLSNGLDSVLSDAMSCGYAALALEASEGKRGWPVARAAALVESLHEEFGLRCVFVGSAADVPAGDALVALAGPRVVNLAGRTSLPELLMIFRNAAVSIAVDSGPMHLAAAAGSPVVALFGPGDPRQSRPWSNEAAVVSNGSPCGCANSWCEFTNGPGRCMRAIDPGAVVEAVRGLARRTAAGQDAADG